MSIKKQANEYIAGNKNKVNQTFKPEFHFAPEIGWINDPNGFCRFNGKYHLFYQFHPYDSKWGPMHWGHAASDDLIKWEHLPVALAPDSSFDKDGCFSGTAMILDDKLYLFYTGVHDGKQEQCIAWSTDGINFEKYADNPVIGEKNLAPDISIRDFRDPKIVKKDGRFYCIIGANSKAVVYESENMFDWKYAGDLLDKKLGVMWECPDYFEEDGQAVFIASVCGENPENIDKDKFIFFSTPTYFMLERNDFESLPVKYKNFDELEHGFDFYAPQVLQSPQNKNIIIAWMYTFGKTIATDMDNLSHGWANCMTLPREISIRNGKFYQNPVKAIENYRHNEVICKEFKFDSKAQNFSSSHNAAFRHIDGILSFDEIGGKNCEILLTADISGAKKFTVTLPGGVLAFDKADGLITFDRTGFGYDMRSQEQKEKSEREIRKIKYAGSDIGVRIFIDNSALEIFINGGEKIISSRFYPEGKDYSVFFESDGLTSIKEIKKYDIII